MPEDKKKLIAQNKKARHDYYVENTLEAGIELLGTEVKSLRAGGCNLKDCYCQIEAGQMWVEGMHISPCLLYTSVYRGRGGVFSRIRFAYGKKGSVYRQFCDQRAHSRTFDTAEPYV